MLGIRIDSGNEGVRGVAWDSCLYVAAGTDPYELVDYAVAAAAALSGGARRRVDKALPGSLDVLGWCTWDAFYFTVSARGVVAGLQALASGGTPAKWLIIDDGWQVRRILDTSAYRVHLTCKA